MATKADVIPRIHKSNDACARIDRGTADGTGFSEGDFVVYSSGLLAAAAADGNEVAAGVKIIGQALRDASASDTGVPVQVIRPGDRVLMNLTTKTGAAHTLAQANVGADVGLYVDAGGHWSASISPSSGQEVGTITGIHYDSAIGDSNAWVEVEFFAVSLLTGGEGVA